MSNHKNTTAEESLTARSCVYAFLSALFSYPGTEKFSQLAITDFRDGILQACRVMDAAKDGEPGSRLEGFAGDVFGSLAANQADAENAYVVTFGHTVARDVSLYELEHLQRQEAYYQTQWLADIQGFYRAFGLDSRAGTERPDHLCVQTEFMAFVCAKECVALKKYGAGERSHVCFTARQHFLNDHLGVWAGKMAGRLRVSPAVPFYQAAGSFLNGWLADDMLRHGISQVQIASGGIILRKICGD